MAGGERATHLRDSRLSPQMGQYKSRHPLIISETHAHPHRPQDPAASMMPSSSAPARAAAWRRCILALGGMKVLMIEAGRNYDPVTETPDVPHAGDGPAARRAHTGKTVRLLRCHRRWRLAGAGRAIHQQGGHAGRLSGGGARACWAAARTTGAASPCASARTISSR